MMPRIAPHASIKVDAIRVDWIRVDAMLAFCLALGIAAACCLHSRTAFGQNMTGQNITGTSRVPPLAGPTGPQGVVLRLPPGRGVSKASGLYLELMGDDLPSSSFGYHTVEFVFRSPSPLVADTSITVKGVATDYYYRETTLSIEADVDLLAGQTSGTVKLRIPQYSEWKTLRWDVWVDGAHDPQLSVSQGQPFSATTVWHENRRRLASGVGGQFDLLGYHCPSEQK